MKTKVSVEKAFEIIKNDFIEKLNENDNNENLFFAMGLSEEWERDFKSNGGVRLAEIALKPKVANSIRACFKSASSIEEAVALVYTYVKIESNMRGI